MASDKAIDDTFYLRARAVPLGPDDGSVSLRARRGIMTVLVLCHAHHDGRCRHEGGKLIAALQDGIFPRVKPRELVEAPRPAPQFPNNATAARLKPRSPVS